MGDCANLGCRYVSGGLLSDCPESNQRCTRNQGFWTSFARPVLFRPLGCIPHVWECFARGLKCSIVSALAPLPLMVRSVGDSLSLRFRADVGISPCGNGRNPASNFVGGDAHIAPPARLLLYFRVSAAAAQEIAEAPPVADEARRFRGSVPIGGRKAVGNRLTQRCSGKSILHFGIVLQIPCLSAGKEVQKPSGFWRAFGNFSRAGKVPRRRPDKPIPPPFLRQNKSLLRYSPGTAQAPRAGAPPRRGPRRARYSP